MISIEHAKSLDMEGLSALKTSDFTSRGLRPTEAAQLVQALHDRLIELDPGFGEFLELARPELMSNLGSPGAFDARVAKMSPVELIVTWNTLTAGGIDDVEFVKAVHKHMALNMLELFGVPMTPAEYTKPRVGV